MKRLFVIILIFTSHFVFAQKASKKDHKKQRLSEVLNLQGKPRPLILINDTVYKGSMDSIDLDKVASMDVIKNTKDAKSIYGESAANGVVMIRTKQDSVPQDQTLSSGSAMVEDTTKQQEKHPLFIVDGQKMSFEAIQAIDANMVLQVEILKPEGISIKKFGDEGKNGVAIVITKPYAVKQISTMLSKFSLPYANYIINHDAAILIYVINNTPASDLSKVYNLKAEEISKVDFIEEGAKSKVFITTTH